MDRASLSPYPTFSEKPPTTRCIPLVALVLVLGASAFSRLALAQAYTPTAQELETARTLYKDGKELRARGDLRGAIEKLRAAHALGRTPVTGIELARTYALARQVVEGRETALSIARIPVASDETDKSAEARAEAVTLAEELRARIATLVVRIEGRAAGETARLLVDDVAVPPVAMSEPQKVDPGRHELVARAGEGSAAREGREAAEVKEGETVELTLTLRSPQPPIPLPARTQGRSAEAPAHESRGMPTLATIGFTTAVAGGLVGLVAVTTAVAKRGQLDGECHNMTCDSGTPGAGDLNTARGWALAADVSLAIGGAGIVIGVIGLLRGERASAPPPSTGASMAPWVGARAAGVHGTF